MPTYMDSHIILGNKAEFLIEEYCAIISAQKTNSYKYLNYWLDEKKR